MNSQTIQAINLAEQERYLFRTGIFVDIQNLGKNTQLLAMPEQESFTVMSSGVGLKTSVFRSVDGNFSNVYDLFWHEKKSTVVPEVHSANTQYSLLQQIKNDPAALAVVNGAFFFLTDIADSKPLDLQYDLCVRDGKIFGLPSKGHPILYVQDGILQTKEITARGTIAIGTQTLSWVGAYEPGAVPRKGTAVLYNSHCSDIIRMRDPKTNLQIGILDNENIYTPRKKDVLDIVVAHDIRKRLRVVELHEGGGTHFYKGLFILQIKKKDNVFQKGDFVFPLTLDTVSLSSLTSGITVGRSVRDSFYTDPVRFERRDARTIIAKDTKGFIHCIIFDGSKYIPGFQGVSPKDIEKIFTPKKYQWAYYLDGGGSSRMIVRQENTLRICANEFSFKKLKNGHHLWDWQNGRNVASSIVLRVVQ